jgi:hypothetical protein
MHRAGYSTKAAIGGALLVFGIVAQQRFDGSSADPSPTTMTLTMEDSQRVKDEGSGVDAGLQQSHAPPTVTLLDGEQVAPDEVMVLMRSILVESGESIQRIRRSVFNLTMVRSDVNNYMTGYSLPVTWASKGFTFLNEVKAWRSTSMSGISVWPPIAYPCAREETMRHAAGLEPMYASGAGVLNDNLRVCFFPIRVDYNGMDYQVRDSLLAFFVHPQTGMRMTAIVYNDRVVGAIDKPLGVMVHLYLADTEMHKGPLGIGKVHTPTKFFADRVEFESEMVELDGALSEALQRVLSQRTSNIISQENLDQLRVEMQQSVERN